MKNEKDLPKMKRSVLQLTKRQKYFLLKKPVRNLKPETIKMAKIQNQHPMLTTVRKMHRMKTSSCGDNKRSIRPCLWVNFCGFHGRS